jgi:hypothetical protein
MRSQWKRAKSRRETADCRRQIADIGGLWFGYETTVVAERPKSSEEVTLERLHKVSSVDRGRIFQYF